MTSPISIYTLRVTLMNKYTWHPIPLNITFLDVNKKDHPLCVLKVVKFMVTVSTR